VPHRRDLRLLVSAVGLSSLGDNVALVPLAVLVQERGGSGAAVAGLFVALWLPAALLAGPAGLLADRVDPRRVLALTALVAAATCATMTLVGGLAPLLAGGVTGALLADAATFLALVGMAAALRVKWAPHPAVGRDRMREGIAFLARDDELAPVVGVVFLSLLLMTATPAAALFFAQDDLGTGARTGRRTSSRARSSTSARPSASAVAPSPRSTACATAPSSSP
jgi:MFS family permease